MSCNCNCSSAENSETPAVSRRSVVAGAGVGAAALGLSACGASEDSASNKQATDKKTLAGPTDMAAVSDVPVGSAFKATSGETTVILSQPTAGTFKAFSSACTHQGCQVNVQKTAIVCPCHGSQFKIEDGSVIGGPAPSPLPQYKVEAQNGRLIVSESN